MSRVGNFSSSAIWKLIKKGSRPMTEEELKAFKIANPKSKKKNINDGFSEAGLTYIQEKKYEKNLGRALNSEHSAKPTTWGTFVEKMAFDLLPLEYKLESKDRLVHKTIKRWTGAPDINTEKVVGDIKCPYTMKSFCELVEFMKSVESLRENKKEFYWQLVSNAILSGKSIAELVIYCPYLEELKDIREAVDMFDGDQNKVAWINWANDDELPHLIKDEFYENMYRFKFEVPKEDVKYLTERVEEAVILLEQ